MEMWIYFTTACLHSQWQLLTNIVTLKKSQLFIGFPYIRLKNSKFVECCKSYFHLKYSFRHPFEYDTRDSSTTVPL